MQKEELHILIVDDDPTLGLVMKEAFTRAGFKVLLSNRPDEALSIAKLQTVHAMIIDCMLPKMNGRELATKIKAECGSQIPLILMSGIYKDKNFMREAIQQTGAVAFLSKPFDLPDLIAKVEKACEHLIDVKLPALQGLLTRETISGKERIRAINDTSDIHAYDLPLIFSLLMHHKISGHLNVVSADGEMSGVGFQDGNIVQVTQKDAQSYFGLLMVEYGFVTQEEIEEVMRAKGKTKKTGERLVEANVLSPHAIQIVMAEQEGIRLGRTIAETSVKVNFIDSDDIRIDAVINKDGYIELLNEWMMSKLKVDWLKSFYMPWMRYSLKPGPEYKLNSRAFSVPVVARIPDLLRNLQKASTLEQAIADTPGTEAEIYAALHVLIVSRVFRFGEPNLTSDHDTRRKRLAKLDEDLSKQNHFQRLGVSNKAKDPEIKRAYHELAKILHPDKLSADTPKDIKDLARSSFEKITKAYEILSNSNAREDYNKELETGNAEAILECEKLKDQALGYLTKGDYKKARELMELAVATAPPSSNVMLHLLWAKLKSPGTDRKDKLVNSIRDELAKIPPEDRHTSTYYFVKGLHLKLSGDAEGAKRSLNHAVSLDPDFIDARREVSLLNSQSAAQKPVSFLNGDLKDVVGLLFKKKK